MNAILIIVGLSGLLLFLSPVIAAFTSLRHPLLGIPSLLLAALAALGAHYSLAESASLVWTIAYGLLATLGVLAGFCHFGSPFRRSSNGDLVIGGRTATSS